MARTPTVGYTPVGAPRFRPLRALVVLLLVLAAGAGGWAAGRGSGGDDTARPAAAARPPGPAAPAPASAAGLPRTPEAAGEAFAALMRANYAMTLAPVEDGERWLAEIAAPGAAETVREKFNPRGPLNGSRSGINQFMPVRIITVQDPDASVRVLVWGTEVQGLLTDGVNARLQPIARWSTTVGQMVWAADRWKLADIVSTEPGPTPLPFDGPDPAERFVRVLSVAGRPAGDA